MSKKLLSFTLRELLFAFVAISAVVALISINWRSTPVGIPELLKSPLSLVQEVAGEKMISFTGPVGPSESGGGGGTSYNLSYEYDVAFELRVEDEAEIKKLMGGLNSKIAEMLENNGCLFEKGWSGENEDRPDKFSFNYRRKKSRGTVHVRLFPSTGPPPKGDIKCRSWTIWFLSRELTR